MGKVCEGKTEVNVPESKINFLSKNFHAIADANLQMYTRCVESGITEELTLKYLFVWQENK